MHTTTTRSQVERFERTSSLLLLAAVGALTVWLLVWFVSAALEPVQQGARVLDCQVTRSPTGAAVSSGC